MADDADADDVVVVVVGPDATVPRVGVVIIVETVRSHRERNVVIARRRVVVVVVANMFDEVPVDE